MSKTLRTEQFLAELKELLAKYHANINTSHEEDDSFFYLNVRVGDEKNACMDSGYLNLSITAESTPFVDE